MSATREEVIRYGSNQIRGFVGGELTLSITPTSVLIPAVVIDHLDMPCSFKDKDVAADAISFTSNDSTHAQTVAATGDLNLTSPAALYASGTDSALVSGGTAGVAGTTSAELSASAGNSTVSASASIKLTAGTTIDVTGIMNVPDLRLPITTGSTSYLPMQEGGYFTDALVGTTVGAAGTTTIFLWRVGYLVFMQLQGMWSNGTTIPNTNSHCSFGAEHMPAQFRPAHNTVVPVRTLVSTGGAPSYQIGHARILNSGVIDVYPTMVADSKFNGGFAGTPVGYTEEGFDDVVAHWHVHPSP